MINPTARRLEGPMPLPRAVRGTFADRFKDEASAAAARPGLPLSGRRPVPTPLRSPRPEVRADPRGEPPPARPVPTGTLEQTHLGRYMLATREPAYSLLFLLPLVLAYEFLALLLNLHHTVEVRNGADVILREILVMLRIQDVPLALVVAVVVSLGAVVSHRQGRDRLQGRFFAAMIGESCVWAILIGAISRRMVRIFFSASVIRGQGPLTKLMLFLGAGVYEELVFRVLLIAFFYPFFRRLLRMSNWNAGTLSVLVAALLFSLFHHLGPFGEPFRLAPFLFRFFAGLVLSALYVTRGLGITAWSHALYDVFLYMGLA